MSEKIEIDIVRNLKDLLQAFDLRREEFVKKQNVPEEMEFDGNDFRQHKFWLKQAVNRLQQCGFGIFMIL